MTNDTKNLLMQYLYRFASHYEIEQASTISFRQRTDLLDKLKKKDNDAWVIINSLFEAFIKSDRIQSDKEKYDKARILWDAESSEALKEKVNAEAALIKFCKDHHIVLGNILVKE